MFVDALCRAALKKKGVVTLDNIDVVALADNLVCYIADTYPLEDPCRICGSMAKEASYATFAMAPTIVTAWGRKFQRRACGTALSA